MSRGSSSRACTARNVLGDGWADGRCVRVVELGAVPVTAQASVRIDPVGGNDQEPTLVGQCQCGRAGRRQTAVSRSQGCVVAQDAPTNIDSRRRTLDGVPGQQEISPTFRDQKRSAGRCFRVLILPFVFPTALPATCALRSTPTGSSIIGPRREITPMIRSSWTGVEHESVECPKRCDVRPLRQR